MNPHVRYGHGILNPERLPIPPLGRGADGPGLRPSAGVFLCGAYPVHGLAAFFTCFSALSASLVMAMRLIALRKAFAEASTLSVETPRPR